jgi:hypothetical protein
VGGLLEGRMKKARKIIQDRKKQKGRREGGKEGRDRVDYEDTSVFQVSQPKLFLFNV